MGCAVSKRSAPVTPVYDSGELLASNSIWNRPRTGASEEHAVDRERQAGRDSATAARVGGASGYESEKTSSVTNCTSSVSMSTGTVTSNSNSNGSKLLGNLHKYIEGEAMAAGWPAWLSSVAAEAVQGWIPLKADSFEKLEKVSYLLILIFVGVLIVFYQELFFFFYVQCDWLVDCLNEIFCLFVLGIIIEFKLNDFCASPLHFLLCFMRLRWACIIC